MVTDLKLKGNDLLIYAIIYGFTQDGEQEVYSKEYHLNGNLVGDTRMSVNFAEI